MKEVKITVTEGVVRRNTPVVAGASETNEAGLVTDAPVAAVTVVEWVKEVDLFSGSC